MIDDDDERPEWDWLKKKKLNSINPTIISNLDN